MSTVSADHVTVDRIVYRSALIDAIECYRHTLPDHLLAGCCTRDAQCARWMREAGRFAWYREALAALGELPAAPVSRAGQMGQDGDHGE
jgi:hypothetical protein